jgi:signal transduction histidine kinase
VSEFPEADAAVGHDPGWLRERQLELTLATDRRIIDHTNTLAGTLQFIVTQTRRLLNASHVDILFEYPDGLRNEISSDQAEIGYFIPFEQSIAGLVLSNHQPVLVNDLQSDPQLRQRYFPREGERAAETSPAVRSPGHSVVAAELTLDGDGIGVVNVEAPPDVQFDQSHLDFVEAVARQISMAISHAALFDEDNFRNATDRLLVEATKYDSDMVMRQVLDHILSALNSLAFVKPDAAEILFADPQDGQSLVVAYSTNNADIGVRVDIGTSVCGEAFREGRTVLLQRAFERPDYRPIIEDMRCEMAIPITFGGSNRFPIGVLNLESSRENAFSNVGHVLAERFSRRVVNAIAMTKIRADIDSELQDQLMVLAADQVLNAVHRINNHVGSIRAIVAELLDDLDSPRPPDNDDLAGRLRRIMTDAEHTLEIPGELRRRIGTLREAADVNEQVEIGLSSVRIPQYIELVTDLSQGLPNIPCTALDLVVENLLLNAVKAMQNRPGQLHVTTWLDKRLPREPFVVVTVRDAGVGMTRQERDGLFEPGQTSRRGSGLGFGMLWVRGWVRRTQGLIDIYSEPGSGTTVNIRFQIDPQLIDRTSEGGNAP